MPRSPQSRPKRKLSPALYDRVSSYALAATATGVSMLALAPASAAEIVYTPAKGRVTRNVPFNIDLNGDGVVDFTILDHAKGDSFRSTQFLDVMMPHQGNAAMCNWVACSSGFSFAAALLAGVKIGNSYYAWMSSRALMAWEESSQGQSFSSGSWAHRSVHPARYLGLRFLIAGETHFGWARLSVQFRKDSPRTWEAHVTGYAYETIPNQPIIAGQTVEKTKDADGRVNEAAPVRPTSLRRQEPSTSHHPATLGALALRAEGLALWRGEESAQPAVLDRIEN